MIWQGLDRFSEPCSKTCYGSDDTPPTPEMVLESAEVPDRAVRFAAEKGDVPIFEFLVDQGVPVTRQLIPSVCRSDTVGICEAMLRQGRDLNEWVNDKPPLS